MASALHVVRTGSGTPLLLVHGSAADHTTWSIQLASRLTERFTLIAYDRRSPSSGRELTVEDHADDAAALLAAEPARGLVIGSSFGAVVVLDLLRRHPGACRGAVLIEPPMGPSDVLPASSAELLPAFDREVAERGGPAAAELFLRTVLGTRGFERMPRAYQLRSVSKWREIRSDSAALIRYQPRYAELAAVTVPVLLLGGERSASYFRPTLEALARVLPAANLEILKGAGHMLHAEAHRRFAELVTAFADTYVATPDPMD
ncbi:MAG: alpha/beta fold hydrolase [Kofleriaceae bacterium]